MDSCSRDSPTKSKKKKKKASKSSSRDSALLGRSKETTKSSKSSSPTKRHKKASKQKKVEQSYFDAEENFFAEKNGFDDGFQEDKTDFFDLKAVQTMRAEAQERSHLRQQVNRKRADSTDDDIMGPLAWSATFTDSEDPFGEISATSQAASPFGAFEEEGDVGKKKQKKKSLSANSDGGDKSSELDSFASPKSSSNKVNIAAKSESSLPILRAQEPASPQCRVSTGTAVSRHHSSAHERLLEASSWRQKSSLSSQASVASRAANTRMSRTSQDANDRRSKLRSELQELARSIPCASPVQSRRSSTGQMCRENQENISIMAGMRRSSRSVHRRASTASSCIDWEQNFSDKTAVNEAMENRAYASTERTKKDQAIAAASILSSTKVNNTRAMRRSSLTCRSRRTFDKLRQEQRCSKRKQRKEKEMKEAFNLEFDPLVLKPVDFRQNLFRPDTDNAEKGQPKVSEKGSPLTDNITSKSPREAEASAESLTSNESWHKEMQDLLALSPEQHRRERANRGSF